MYHDGHLHFAQIWNRLLEISMCFVNGRAYIKTYRSWNYILKCKSCLKNGKASIQMEIGFDLYALWSMSEGSQLSSVLVFTSKIIIHLSFTAENIWFTFV